MSDNINITPDMINNLVNALKSKNANNSNSSSESNKNNNSAPFSEDTKGIFSNFTADSFSSTSNNSNNKNNIDINTIIKIKSIIDSLNKNDDPNSNLLYSLKPYLRKSRQEKLDQYANILKISKIVNTFSKNKEDLK